MKIGLLSDTHNYLDPLVFEYFAECDQIWHAGDFGSIEVSEQLSQFKPLLGVYGNIDGADIRMEHPLDRRWNCEGMDVWMTHIGGYPRHYKKRIREKIHRDPPDLFICGHSHILKIVRDHVLNGMLVINPGAAGRYGFHQVRTLVRFEITDGKMHNVEVIELGFRTS